MSFLHMMRCMNDDGKKDEDEGGNRICSLTIIGIKSLVNVVHQTSDLGMLREEVEDEI